MNRRGYTMVEMIVVLAAAVHIDGRRDGRARLADHACQPAAEQLPASAGVAGRFAEDLRRDVHWQSAEVLDIVARPASGLSLQLADGTTVVYAAVGDGVERVSQRSVAVESRELYRIADAQELPL